MIVWDFIKRHWKTLLLIVTPVVGVIVDIIFRKNTGAPALVDDIKKIDDIHKKEQDQTNAALLEEQKLLEQNAIDLQKKQEEIAKQHDQAVKDLDASTQNRANDIVNDAAGDPDKLADAFSTSTGIPVYKGKPKP